MSILKKEISIILSGLATGTGLFHSLIHLMIPIQMLTNFVLAYIIFYYLLSYFLNTIIPAINRRTEVRISIGNLSRFAPNEEPMDMYARLIPPKTPNALISIIYPAILFLWFTITAPMIPIIENIIATNPKYTIGGQGPPRISPKP